MPYINIVNVILNDYDMWRHNRTFFERWEIDTTTRVYMFACHFGHTDTKFKINLSDFLRDQSDH